MITKIKLTLIVLAVLIFTGSGTPQPLSVPGVVAGSCSSSCLVQQGIISCRRFDRPADIRSCARRHPSASVLDLSYIDIKQPLSRRSLTGLRHIEVLYLDGSRVRRVEADALTGMRRLRMVFARRMRGPLPPILDAVIAAPSVRQVALADNFVVCSCSWLRAVELLAAVDIVVVDMLDAAPRCSSETVGRCRGTHSGMNSTTHLTVAQTNLVRVKIINVKKRKNATRAIPENERKMGNPINGGPKFLYHVKHGT